MCEGIAVSGSGFGTSIFAPLIAYFAQTYGWRNSVLFLSAVVLNNALFGALFRPLKKVQPASSTEYSDACTCFADFDTLSSFLI